MKSKGKLEAFPLFAVFVIFVGFTPLYQHFGMLAVQLTSIAIMLIGIKYRSQWPQQDIYQPFVSQPLDSIKFSDDYVQVEQHRIELRSISKLVLELEQGQGILQFPYNNGGVVNIRFPAKYLYQLKQRFNQHLPNVTYIS